MKAAFNILIYACDVWPKPVCFDLRGVFVHIWPPATFLKTLARSSGHKQLLTWVAVDIFNLYFIIERHVEFHVVIIRLC